MKYGAYEGRRLEMERVNIVVGRRTTHTRELFEGIVEQNRAKTRCVSHIEYRQGAYALHLIMASLARERSQMTSYEIRGF